MSDFEKMICPHCFQNGFENGKCQKCGYVLPQNYNANALPPFTKVGGIYEIGSVIGAGGFGITYAARNLQTGERCAIKEYFPSEFVYRDNATGMVCCKDESEKDYYKWLERFYKEAVTLSKIRSANNGNIVDIQGYLKANNTAYIIMEFIDGVNLKRWMVANNRVFTYAQAKMIFIDIASVLCDVHKMHLLHRDLTPENVLIMPNGRIKVIDFGSARDYVKNAMGMSVLVKKGFAPIEQYSSNKKQGPYTDIYSLCCTTYFILTGRYIPDAFDRVNGAKVPRLDEVNREVPAQFASVIEKGMAVYASERYPNVEAMLTALDPPKPSPPEPLPPQPIPPIPPEPLPPQPIPPIPPRPEPPWTEEKPPQKAEQPKNRGFLYKLKLFLGIISENPETPPYEKPMNSFSKTLLRINTGPASGFCFEITHDGSYTIGRSAAQCDAPIAGNFPEISRLHCIITSQKNGNRLLIEDKSANGTYVKRLGLLEKGRQYDIRSGDIILLATEKYPVEVVKKQ